MEEIKLNIHNIESDGNDVVIRTGEALPLKEPLKVAIVGNIDAVSRYIKQRGSVKSQIIEVEVAKTNGGLVSFMNNSIFLDDAIILVDREKLTIELETNPLNVYAPKITGKLEISPELAKFNINAEKKYTREGLVSLLKVNKIFFADKEEHAVLLSRVKQFTARVNKDIQDGSDGRGNNTSVNNQTVDTELNTEFTLNIPIFKGEAPSKFIVEIGLDITEGSARLWLESADLHELIIRKRDEIFEKELVHFTDFCVIEK